MFYREISQINRNLSEYRLENLIEIREHIDEEAFENLVKKTFIVKLKKGQISDAFEIIDSFKNFSFINELLEVIEYFFEKNEIISEKILNIFICFNEYLKTNPEIKNLIVKNKSKIEKSIFTAIETNIINIYLSAKLLELLNKIYHLKGIIDLSEIEKQFENKIIELVSKYLSKNSFQEAETIIKTFDGINFSERINTIFTKSVLKHNIIKIIRIKKYFGHILDPEIIKEHQEEIKSLLSEMIEQIDCYSIYKIFEIIKLFENEIDFSKVFKDKKEKIINYIESKFDKNDIQTAIQLLEKFYNFIDLKQIVNRHKNEILKYYKEMLENGMIRKFLLSKKIYKDSLDFESIEEIVFNNLKQFNLILEEISGNFEEIINLFDSKVLERNKVAHLYIIGMLALHKQIYDKLLEKLKSERKDIEYFEKYTKFIDEISKNLENIGKNQVNKNKLSFNLEIESRCIDEILEIDTNITNNYEELITLIESIDEINQSLKDDIKSELPRLPIPLDKKKIVGVYDSIHINIGLPFPKEIKDILEDELIQRSGIQSLIELIGLIYNPLGRTKYMLQHNLYKTTIDYFPLKGYKYKLQIRFFALNFTENNTKFFEIIFEVLSKILTLYKENPEIARNKLNKINKKLAKIIKSYTIPETNNNYSNYILELKSFNIDEYLLSQTEFNQQYFPQRNKILKEILKFLKSAMNNIN